MDHLLYTFYLTRWKELSLLELKKEQNKLINKINSIPNESRSVKNSLKDILGMLETYMDTRIK